MQEQSVTCISSITDHLKCMIGAKICALMAHIRYDLCTKGHSNHPTWPKSMLMPSHEFNLYFVDLSQVQGKKIVQIEWL